jgi:hypothetical protein
MQSSYEVNGRSRRNHVAGMRFHEEPRVRQGNSATGLRVTGAEENSGRKVSPSIAVD